MSLQRLRHALTGISGILVTPFNAHDMLDMPKLKPVVNRSIEAGVHILVSNGNTGEFYSLTSDETTQAVSSVAELVNGRVPLLAGIGRGVNDACRLAAISARAGADALMIHQPPDPFVAARGIVDYILRVREASGGLPLVLYLRNDTIGLKAIESLCSIEGVIAVKWATPNIMKLAEAIRNNDPSIIWVCGLAEVWAPPFYAVGARGFTSGLINVWPQLSVRIHAALERGDFVKARAAIDIMRAFEDVRAQEMGGVNVSAVKAALALIGHDCGHARPPAGWPLEKDQIMTIEAFLESVPAELSSVQDAMSWSRG